jgi:integral membrane protein
VRNPVKNLRIAGYVEGVSYLLLLGVAMPLKYLADLPLAVRVMGSLHGLLFVVYVVVAVRAARSRGWPVERLLEVLAAAVFPLGPFVLDRRLRRDEMPLGPAPTSPAPPVSPRD